MAPRLLRILKIFRFIRFLKLLRVLKLSGLKQKYEEMFNSDSLDILWAFSKLMILILFFAHTLACLFWLVGISANEAITWPKQFGLIDESTSIQYVTSLYWSITTMMTVGYGDIHAVNTYERLYCMFSMIISSGVYAFTLSEIVKRVSEFNQAAVLFKENMFYVGKWMQYHDLRRELRMSIRRFLEY